MRKYVSFLCVLIIGILGKYSWPSMPNSGLSDDVPENFRQVYDFVDFRVPDREFNNADGRLREINAGGLPEIQPSAKYFSEPIARVNPVRALPQIVNAEGNFVPEADAQEIEPFGAEFKAPKGKQAEIIVPQHEHFSGADGLACTSRALPQFVTGEGNCAPWAYTQKIEPFGAELKAPKVISVMREQFSNSAGESIQSGLNV